MSESLDAKNYRKPDPVRSPDATLSKGSSSAARPSPRRAIYSVPPLCWLNPVWQVHGCLRSTSMGRIGAPTL